MNGSFRHILKIYFCLLLTSLKLQFYAFESIQKHFSLMGFFRMEEVLVHGKSSSKETKFDVVIGHIEDIIVEDVFQNMQMNFMDKYYAEFEDTEENKLSYTPIFNEYVTMLEKHIERELLKRIPKFNMVSFMKELSTKQNQISEEILELLLSFTDFLTFKQLMLDHKAYKEGNYADLSFDLTVKSLGNAQQLI